MWDMCQMLNIWHISHTKPRLTPFIRCCKCYSTIINLQWYGNMWYMSLLIFYSSFTHVSLSSSRSAIQYSLPPSPSPLSHSLSSSLFLVALFSSHSWIWATINFLSTITDLYPSLVFFSPFVCSLLSVLSAWVWLWVWVVVVISDCGSGCDFRLWSAWA